VRTPVGAPGAGAESEERFRLLVESVKDYAIFILDPGGHVLTWNLGAERIKGYKAAEILGKHFSVFYPPEDIAAGKTERELEVAARVGRFEDEGWRVRIDGLSEGRCVSIGVHNEGPPIPAEVQRTIFSPFRRGERESRSSKTAGLGLGLYISREITIAHGGGIDLQSSAAEGTTFRVTLPATS